MMLGAQLETIARQIELSHGSDEVHSTAKDRLDEAFVFFGSMLLAMGEKVSTLGRFKTKANS
jgi:hypothetical protein